MQFFVLVSQWSFIDFQGLRRCAMGEFLTGRGGGAAPTEDKALYERAALSSQGDNPDVPSIKTQ
jgi:hypothetical protein